MNKKPVSIIFLILCFFYAGISFSQSDSIIKLVRAPKLCEIRLVDGSSYQGHIEKQTDSLIYLKSNGIVTILIPRKKITNIDFIKGRTVKDSVGGMQIHIPGIAHNYYVTSSNSFLFHEKKFYGSSNYLLFYNVNYAINHHFSVGVSSTPIGAPLVFNARANFELGTKSFIGMEGLIGTPSYFGPKSFGYGGIIKFTHGSDEGKNYTFFAGYGDVEWWVNSRRGRRGRPPVVGNYYKSYNSAFVGAAVSLPFNHFKNTNFVAEVFIFPSVNIYTVSAALRTFRWKKISLVGGLQYIGTSRSGIGSSPLPFLYITIPYAGFSFRI